MKRACPLLLCIAVQPKGSLEGLQSRALQVDERARMLQEVIGASLSKHVLSQLKDVRMETLCDVVRRCEERIQCWSDVVRRCEDAVLGGCRQKM